MCLTETWLQPDVFSVLNETCPSGYCYLQKARKTGRGGGLYRSHLDLSPLALPKLSSFECLAFNYSSNIILGDFNIHVNNLSCPFAKEFLQVLDCLNLKQYVDVPTHDKGNTLDLVITDFAPLSTPSVYDLAVSDHKVISIELFCQSPHVKPKHEICFRNLKNINIDALTISLQNLQSGNALSATESVEFYNKTLSNILDLQVRTVTFSRSAPWFTSDLQKMKAAGRAFERRTKIAKIHSSLSGPSTSAVPPADLQVGISRLFCSFPEVTLPEVEDIIKRMKSTSCALDPFPTALVKANVSAISPFITRIVNQSLHMETALVRVTNDLLMTADAGSPSLLVLLDLSAAFDTVDHGILLNWLYHSIGLKNDVLCWFESYLTGRSEFVAMGSSRSCSHAVGSGVPQGSVLGPILFIIYMLPLGKIISRLGMSFHCYADDTQLYMKTDTQSSPTPSSLSTLTACLEEIRAWMNNNFLQLNSSKTEAILIGSPHQIRTSTINCITFSGQDFPLSPVVTNFGVRFEPHLTFEAHIKHLCKTSFHHHRNIARLRPTLTLRDAEKLVHAFVSSRLDYCNALLIGIPNKSIQKLQHVQNCAARILMRVRKYEHITPILQSLHWLHISARIEYKVSLLTHQCIHGDAPMYLKELLIPQTSVRSLRSTNTHRLLPPRTKTRTLGDRAFCTAAPRLWNALPDHLRAPQASDVFKKGLKTHLFKKFFNV
ncbi:RNA-directed DNA polymerase from mobile element jockey [Labeo rohita]|uniref:RNA-directed DNA polymerase from mobile element jockey n=1 Tax=Labeo rohita TaxID=84645 RepID=A0ABQ8L463_LABRO|nr:RNA-directed DNA polymerase from mobile element jockey [Labeo rohita]